MKIPVILLNYNSTADCRKCIASLKQQEGVELEIVVVDNCSTPDNRRDVEELCKVQDCTFIANDKNTGYNAGNNIGLRYAASKGYEYALIANPDMEFPQKDYIQKLEKIISGHEEYAIVTSDIVTVNGIHQNPMKADGSWLSTLGWIKELICRQPRDSYSFIDNWKESHECRKVSGCCFMIKMVFLKKIGFFDENVFLYCEESILSKQAEHIGMKMYYTSDCQSLHNHQASTKGNPIKRFNAWYSSRHYYIKHYSDYSWYGKTVATVSMWLYTRLLIIMTKVKRK